MSDARPLIGFGRVWHRRLRPVAHAFDYPTCFLLLPMRALRERPCGLLARNRRGALSFRDADHGDGRADALAWFDELLAREGVAEADGEVWLQTYPRLLGHAFKPLSLWFAHRRDGALAAVLAEVNNTFGERHCYLMSGPDVQWDRELQARKVFHVSPFCAIEGCYRFRFVLRRASASAQPAYSSVRVDHDDDSGPLLQTGIGAALQPLDAASRRRAVIGMPLHGVGVLARIHWQALRLAIKRVPFHRQPAPPDRFVTR